MLVKPTLVPLLLSGFALCLALVLGSGYAMARRMRWQSRFAARVHLVHGERPRSPANPAAIRKASLHVVSAIGNWVVQRGLLPSATRAELELMLGGPGQRGGNGIGLFVGSKILLAICLPLLSVGLVPSEMVPSGFELVPPFGLFVIGLVLPDNILSYWHRRSLRRLESGLADALDVMVICAQAGIGMAPAMLHVTRELALGQPEVAREFAITTSELQVNADSRVPLRNLGMRSGLDGFKRLAGTLLQTQQYGTPLAEALSTLSAELREEALVRFEARAARIGVLLTLPTLVFIMPCVFLIAGGPAAMQVIRTLAQ